MEHLIEKTGYVEVDGARLFYETAGTGEPVVLLHAGIADRTMWDPQLQALAARFQVVRYDLRGFGRSEGRPDGSLHADDLLGVMQALGIEQAHLVGCSAGGSAVLDFTLDYPEAVRSQVLVSAVPSGLRLVGEPPGQFPLMIEAVSRGDLVGAAELGAEIWVDGPERSPVEVDAGLRERVRRWLLTAFESGALNFMEAEPEVGAVDRVGGVRAPTLVIVGELDHPAVVGASEWTAANIRGARLHVIGGAAHLPNLEAPAEFNRVVLEFLTSTARLAS